MRFSRSVFTALVAGILYATPAVADHQPVIAVPGHPHVPVIINGVDASGALVEGDWGLHRAGQMAPAVYFPFPPEGYGWQPPAYHPFTGKRPRLGRHEIIPPANRPLPPPAESYFRYWSNDGTSVPAQTEEYPPVVAPPVILAPRMRY